MRTTITIPKEVLEQLERTAAERGTTISRLIGDAVRIASRPSSKTAPAESFALMTFGRGGRFTHLDVDRGATLMDQGDVDRYGRLPTRPKCRREHQRRWPAC